MNSKLGIIASCIVMAAFLLVIARYRSVISGILYLIFFVIITFINFYLIKSGFPDIITRYCFIGVLIALFYIDLKRIFIRKPVRKAISPLKQMLLQAQKNNVVHDDTDIDEPDKIRTFNYEDIEILRKRVIDAGEKDKEGYYNYYYDEYLYTFRYKDEEIYAGKDIHSDKVHFARYKSVRKFKKPRTLLDKLIYLLIGNTRWWIMKNVYYPSQGDTAIHKEIPYDSILFRKAIEYLIKNEKAKSFYVLIQHSKTGYNAVDFDQF